MIYLPFICYSSFVTISKLFKRVPYREQCHVGDSHCMYKEKHKIFDLESGDSCCSWPSCWFLLTIIITISSFISHTGGRLHHVMWFAVDLEEADKPCRLWVGASGCFCSRASVHQGLIFWFLVEGFVNISRCWLYCLNHWAGGEFSQIKQQNSLLVHADDTWTTFSDRSSR